MSGTPPPGSPHASAHDYASNGLQILQAASDAAAAAQALENENENPQVQALQDATNEAVAGPLVGAIDYGPPPLQHNGQQMHGGGNVMRDPTVNPKLTRLRRACDMCSMRKVSGS